jgi:hypothetical protein
LSRDLEELLLGYKIFKEKYTDADQSTMMGSVAFVVLGYKI